MKAQIIQIGNSQGIRIPKALLEETKISGEIELEVHPEGILIIARADQDVPDDLREKIALFCDVAVEAVIPAPTAETIYEVPLQFHERGLDELIVRELGLEEKAKPADLTAWRDLVDLIM